MLEQEKTNIYYRRCSKNRTDLEGFFCILKKLLSIVILKKDKRRCGFYLSRVIVKYIKSFLIHPLNSSHTVVVMPRTILPRRNRRCALSGTGTRKREEEMDGRGGTCFMEENEISLREVARFDEDKRD